MTREEARGAVCVKHCKKQPSYLMVIYSYIPTTFGTSYKLIVVVSAIAIVAAGVRFYIE